jgi:hypothetical protein
MNEIKSIPFVDSSLTGGERGEGGRGQIAKTIARRGAEGCRPGSERGPLQIPIDMMHAHIRIPTALLPSSAIKTSN